MDTIGSRRYIAEGSERNGAAYQYKDYADRPNDSIQDFYENVAGIDAFTGRRVPSSQLIDMALEYARQKTQKMADSRERGIIGE